MTDKIPARLVINRDTDKTYGPANDDGISRSELNLVKKMADFNLANQQFEALSPEGKRVTIAKDVIKWLSARKIKAITQSYLIVSDEVDDVVNGYGCSACALGSIFVCLVERGAAGGTVRGGDDAFCPTPLNTPLFMRDDLVERMEPYFSLEQLALIELAFEGSTGSPATAKSVTDFAWQDRAEQFYQKLQLVGATDRLRHIMLNIIKNNGTFVP